MKRFNQYDLKKYNIYHHDNFNKMIGPWITVGGVRSTGLTASSGIGEYVGELYHNTRVQMCKFGMHTDDNNNQFQNLK